MGINSVFKGLNTELNPIYHLLALLGAHYILHVSRVRVKGLSMVGRDSPVCMATRYGLDGPDIESRWEGRDIPHPFRPALGLTQPLVQRQKAAGAWR